MQKSEAPTPTGVGLFELSLLMGSAIFLGMGLIAIFYYAPLLKYNGLPWWSQKIFYIHLPAAWGGMAGLFLVLIGCVGYILTRDKRWDALAAAAASPSLLYSTLVLVTGPLWAKPSWNTYWKWDDPRLMSFFAFWLILIAYQMLRVFSEDDEAKRLSSAALGILGSLAVPFVFLSIKLGRSLHPKPVEFDPKVGFTVLLNLIAFFLLFAAMVKINYRREILQQKLFELDKKVAAQSE